MECEIATRPLLEPGSCKHITTRGIFLYISIHRLPPMASEKQVGICASSNCRGGVPTVGFLLWTVLGAQMLMPDINSLSLVGTTLEDVCWGMKLLCRVKP